MNKSVVILAIESSCDDTGVAILKDGVLLCNLIANQDIHKLYGGVVPELASRAHQQNIVPVVDAAIKKAGIAKNEISALAFTRGPGLMGSLLVGVSFAKALALGLGVPLIEVNHMKGHVLAHFIKDTENKKHPQFPFLCLTVSGGHTQIVKVNNIFEMEIIGETTDDAAGEAFDKAAKILQLPYPGGPLIDKYAKTGNPLRFSFPKPQISNFNYSFSGLKTSFMNFVNNETAKNSAFVEENLNDICASIQHTIIDILLNKLKKAALSTGIKQIAIAGGVSANSGLRNELQFLSQQLNWEIFIPKFEYCTDNAAMIGITAHYKYLRHEFAEQSIAPMARYSI
jgi:N6-L-threonylcarbamoyladenine synthase